MKSRLINVRLDAERLRKAQRLREKGVALSDVVREAIDERYGEVTARDERGAAGDILAGILARFPDPRDLPARTYDVHDAGAARRAIRGRQPRHRR
ncbi:MAG TPA: hypothetical protein VL173_15850 [Vicinamibacterales bacterium]|jgi:hypothetical protein|nr:hypothetical protein [Vicinamibacterales bacterium]